MVSLIDNIRSVLGVPEFVVEGSINFGAVCEYFVGAVILCVVISSVFRFLTKVVTR